MDDYKTEVDTIEMAPVKKYEPPSLPTLQDSRSDKNLLKNRPSKWVKVIVVTVVGAVILAVLWYFIRDWMHDAMHFHYGGSGMSPAYFDSIISAM